MRVIETAKQHRERSQSSSKTDFGESDLANLNFFDGISFPARHFPRQAVRAHLDRKAASQGVKPSSVRSGRAEPVDSERGPKACRRGGRQALRASCNGNHGNERNRKESNRHESNRHESNRHESNRHERSKREAKGKPGKRRSLFQRWFSKGGRQGGSLGPRCGGSAPIRTWTDPYVPIAAWPLLRQSRGILHRRTVVALPWFSENRIERATEEVARERRG